MKLTTVKRSWRRLCQNNGLWDVLTVLLSVARLAAAFGSKFETEMFSSVQKQTRPGGVCDVAFRRKGNIPGCIQNVGTLPLTDIVSVFRVLVGYGHKHAIHSFLEMRGPLS